jgi:3-deoxy-D-manno-octulosonate 8-phosphate phosphatase (KDO 8-P phosphatase)
MAKIRLLAMDVDGVLTDGKITYTSAGDEIKSFNVKDGLGLSLAIRAGLKTAIITARQSSIVERRAGELGIHYVFQYAKTKLPVLEGLIAELGITLDDVAYMGDDLPDIPILEQVGLAACPADAVLAVKSVCHYTSALPGGSGALRDVVDHILCVQSTEAFV